MRAAISGFPEEGTDMKRSGRDAAGNRSGHYYRGVDLLKCAGALLIINSHMESIYPKSSLATGGALGNALFFICSGFLLENRIGSRKERSEKLRSLLHFLLKIYVPVTIATVLWAGKDFPYSNFFLKYIWPTYYWFPAAVILFYLAYLPLRKCGILFRRFPCFLLAMGIFYAMYYILLLDTSEWVVEASGLLTVESDFKLIYCFVIFCFGGWIHQNDFTDSVVRRCRVLLPVSVISLYAVKFLFTREPVFYHLQFLNQLSVLLFAVSALIAVKRSGGKERKKDLVSLISGLSLELYLVQFPCIGAAQKTGWRFPLNFVTALALILVSAFVLNRIAGRIADLLSAGIRCAQKKFRGREPRNTK